MTAQLQVTRRDIVWELADRGRSFEDIVRLMDGFSLEHIRRDYTKWKGENATFIASFESDEWIAFVKAARARDIRATQVCDRLLRAIAREPKWIEQILGDGIAA